MVLRGLRSVWRRTGRRAPDGETAQRALAVQEARQALERHKQLRRASGYEEPGVGYGLGFNL